MLVNTRSRYESESSTQEFYTGSLYQELRPVLDLQPRFSLNQKVNTLEVFP